MKKLIAILAAALFGGAAVYVHTADSQGHVLVKEWKVFDRAYRADLPQDALRALDVIIKEASARGLLRDLYDASNRKVDVGSSVNWKDAPQLRSERRRTFENCGNPMLLWLLDGYGLDDINGRKSELEAGHNIGFYLNDKFLQNDYEFLLWRLFRSGRGSAEQRAKVYAQCLEQFGPVMEMHGRMKKLEDRFSALEREKASQLQYRELRADCAAFEKERRALKGRDKAIAANFTVRDILETMDGKSLQVRVEDCMVSVFMQNLASARVSISTPQGKRLFVKKIKNSAKSYYVPDTVRFPLPELADGEYAIKVAEGRIVEKGNLKQYRLSAYITRHSDGWKLYVADYKSGKPAEDFEVLLYNVKDALVASAGGQSCKDGLISLPEDIGKALDARENGRSDYLVCRQRGDDGILRSTDNLYSYGGYTGGAVRLSAEQQPSIKAVILHDSGAYHRGDRVNVKTILYSGMYYDETAVAAAGTAFSVVLTDPDGKQCGSCELNADEYGSAVCGFDIPADAKGGRYRIEVRIGDKVVSRDWIVVDDYVLPDFECVFEEIENLYFSGDTVTVRGRVKAYSGHNIRVDDAFYTISEDNVHHRLEIAPDGSFAVQVQLPQSKWWGTNLTVLVNSATGQTLEFSRYVAPGGDIGFDVDLVNKLEADLDARGSAFVVADDHALFDVKVANGDGVQQKMRISYTLSKNGVTVAQGAVTSPSQVMVQLPGISGSYTILFETRASDSKGEIHIGRQEFQIIKYASGATVLDADVESMFVPHSDALAFDFGTTKGELWGLALLYGYDGVLLHSQPLHLEGERGRDGSLCTLKLPYDASYPDAVALRILYFRKGEFHSIDHVFNRPQPEAPLEISWERFIDEAVPGAEYIMSFKGSPAAQYAVVIFDKSTETVAPNIWAVPYRGARIPSLPGSNNRCGGINYYGWYSVIEEESVSFEATRPMLMKSAGVEMDAANVAMAGRAAPVDDVKAREDFATTICWEPVITPDARGRAQMRFRTSDKTGAFIVQLFAHEKNMRSAVERRQMQVSLPVQLSVAQPQILRSGDRYILKAVVSNKGGALGGKVVLDAKGIGRYTKTINVPARQSAQVQFALDIPDGMERLEVKLVFTDSTGTISDALAFAVPVQGRMQTLTESHSAVCLAGGNRDAIVAELRKQFVNTSSNGAQYSEVSISDMLQQMLSSYKGVGSGDACNSLDLSQDICVAAMYDALRGTKTDVGALTQRLAAYQNADGGIAWFKGMKSSPAVTAAILERFALAGVRGCIDEAKAAAFLDRAVTEGEYAWGRFLSWNGSISLAQYVYVRSFYPQYAFAAKASREFAKEIREYLLPGSDRGFQGAVHTKVLRLSALRNLAASDRGVALADAWGAAGSRRALEASYRADVGSLVQYAVQHKSGGMYYPNLVMPYRGLMASEAYCHSMLARLMDSENPTIAKGIRIWLMTQKETQHWDTGFEFVNAAATILGGPADVLETRVIVMSKTYEKPYAQIKAAGNEFRVSAEYSVVSADGKVHVLKNGDALKAGDKVTATYKLWSAENRSFVKLTAPRHACFTPVDQLSGHYGWWGQCYRQVLADRTEYWFDRFAEEESQVSEQLYVNQTGVFTAPVVQIECIYAPEYRANAAYGGKITAN